VNLCIIPARGGSRRIPRKNIKEFNGKPIIAYSIEAALKSGCFDKVIVSTDDNEIADISKKYGAQVPFIRPNALSNDYVSTISVIKHAIEWIEANKMFVEDICCLYATAPFIRPQTISDAHKKLDDLNFDYCFSATSFEFPIQRAIRITQNSGVEMFYPKYSSTRSQDLEEAYHDAGQFYWGRLQSFKNNVHLFSDTSTPYILPRYLVQDIDTEEDWIQAEAMYKALKDIGKL
jgi:pseudaminic acid cytidylyltransferase